MKTLYSLLVFFILTFNIFAGQIVPMAEDLESAAECSGDYGDTSGASESATSKWIIRLRPIYIDCDSPTSYSIKTELKDVHSAIYEYRTLIYDDDGADQSNAGIYDAGTRLFDSGASFDAATNGSFQTLEETGVTTSLSAGWYWLGVQFESTDTNSDFQYDGTTGNLTLKRVESSFVSPATWNNSTDSTSTAQDCYWFDFSP